MNDERGERSPPGKGKGGRRRPRHPWTKWFESDEFLLTRGKNFTCKVHGMAQMVRDYAQKHGYRVQLKVLDNAVRVTVLERPA